MLSMVYEMIKLALLTLFVVHVGFVNAHGSVTAHLQAVQQVLSQTDGREIREDTGCSATDVNHLSNNLPADCTVAQLNLEAIERSDSNATVRFGNTFCQPRCGNPLLDFYRTCHGEIGQQLSDFFCQLCARNDRGERCYSARVASFIRDTIMACSTSSTSLCQSNCQSALLTAATNVGCCINVLNVGGLFDIESICDIDIPGPCEESTLSGAAAQNMDTIAMALAMLVYMILQ